MADTQCTLAAEYELLILFIGKDRLHDECLVVRKRGTLQQKQELELEEQREKQRQKQLKEKEAIKEFTEQGEKIKIELKKPQVGTEEHEHHEMSCQASFDEKGREIGRKRARRIRKERQRNKQAEHNKKKIVKVDSFMQTVPEDYWLCPWCSEHIAPVSQCGHEAICRAGVQQKRKEDELKARLKQHQLYMEAKKRQRLGLPPLKGQQQRKSEIVHSRSRSRNRDKSNTRSVGNTTNPTIKAKTASAKLDEVHPNDMEGMIKLMQRLCTESKCQLLADSDCVSLSASKCSGCKRAFCFVHRPIGKHSACALKQEPASSENITSVACGWDPDEKKEALKLAMRERKAKLREMRQRC
ncbi:unnamed protein product [Heterobilharzia americana]|nr:unnamed protein product [Heterobilharzia americana]